jgi:hypothetical protein
VTARHLDLSASYREISAKNRRSARTGDGKALRAMLEFSERAKVAIETAPPDLRQRLSRAVDELNTSAKPRPDDAKVMGKPDTWFSRITDTVRLIYFLRPDGIVVDDVIDLRRYGS